MKVLCFGFLVLSAVLLNAQLMDMPEGISYSETLDTYFVSCWQSQNVVAVDSGGNQSEFWTGLSHCANNLLVDNVLFVTYGTHIKAIDILTSTELWDINLSGAVDADGLAMADDGFLYVVTHNNRLFKIDLSNQTPELFVSSGIGSYDQDMIYDADNNRLLICSYQSNCPIFAVSLPDGETSIACETGLNNLDGLTLDAEGNIYLACWGTNTVYKYDHEFSDEPEIISTGHSSPSGIEINKVDNILYVSNFYTDVVQEIQLPSVGADEMIIDVPVKLYQNYPNPFNPSGAGRCPTTTISFASTSLCSESFRDYDCYTDDTEIVIYNLQGQKVKTFPVSLSQSHTVSIIWDGTNEKNQPVSSGIYLYKMKVGNYVQTRKMILAK